MPLIDINEIRAHIFSVVIDITTIVTDITGEEETALTPQAVVETVSGDEEIDDDLCKDDLTSETDSEFSDLSDVVSVGTSMTEPPL